MKIYHWTSEQYGCKQGSLWALLEKKKKGSTSRDQTKPNIICVLLCIICVSLWERLSE